MPREHFVSVTFLSNSSSLMVLYPVSSPAEVHRTTVFTMRDGKFSRLVVTHAHAPSSLDVRTEH